MVVNGVSREAYQLAAYCVLVDPEQPSDRVPDSQTGSWGVETILHSHVPPQGEPANPSIVNMMSDDQNMFMRASPRLSPPA